VAPPERVAAVPLRTSLPHARSGFGVSKWPDYQRCLDRAPKSQTNAGQNRQSIADFTWCLIAASWGWQPQEIAQQLMLISAKAKENGETYAQRTAVNASEAAERNAREGRTPPRRFSNHRAG
jgi:hypothetical protein